MLKRQPSPEAVKLDAAILRVLSEMETVPPESDEYAVLLAKLTTLKDLKSKDKKAPVSRDAVVNTIGGFVQVLVVVAYEQKHVWSTKALSVLKKNPS